MPLVTSLIGESEAAISILEVPLHSAADNLRTVITVGFFLPSFVPGGLTRLSPSGYSHEAN